MDEVVEKTKELGRAFRRNPRIEEAPLEKELMLFDPASSRFFVLNQTMAFIWRRCDGVHTPTSLLEEMLHGFAGVDDAAAAQADLTRALGELREMGLLIDSEGISV
jgi:hypothetical protein